MPGVQYSSVAIGKLVPFLFKIILIFFAPYASMGGGGGHNFAT
jgi:hypothetical protein